jgi:hypothetical protein
MSYSQQIKARNTTLIIIIIAKNIDIKISLCKSPLHCFKHNQGDQLQLEKKKERKKHLFTDTEDTHMTKRYVSPQQ